MSYIIESVINLAYFQTLFNQTMQRTFNKFNLLSMIIGNSISTSGSPFNQTGDVGTSPVVSYTTMTKLRNNFVRENIIPNLMCQIAYVLIFLISVILLLSLLFNCNFCNSVGKYKGGRNRSNTNSRQKNSSAFQFQLHHMMNNTSSSDRRNTNENKKKMWRNGSIVEPSNVTSVTSPSGISSVFNYNNNNNSNHNNSNSNNNKDGNNHGDQSMISSRVVARIKTKQVCAFGLYLIDFYSDLMFNIQLIAYYLYLLDNMFKLSQEDRHLLISESDSSKIFGDDWEFIELFFLAIFGILFMIVPYIVGLFKLFEFQMIWQKDISIGDRIRAWLNEWNVYLLLITVFGGSPFASVNICNVCFC